MQNIVINYHRKSVTYLCKFICIFVCHICVNKKPVVWHPTQHIAGHLRLLTTLTGYIWTMTANHQHFVIIYRNKHKIYTYIKTLKFTNTEKSNTMWVCIKYIYFTREFFKFCLHVRNWVVHWWLVIHHITSSS